MKEPTAELSAKMINTPISRITRISGNNHHFLRSRKKPQRSLRNSILLLLNNHSNPAILQLSVFDKLNQKTME